MLTGGGRQDYPTQILDATRLLRLLRAPVQCVLEFVVFDPVAAQEHPTQIPKTFTPWL